MESSTAPRRLVPPIAALLRAALELVIAGVATAEVALAVRIALVAAIALVDVETAVVVVFA